MTDSACQPPKHWAWRSGSYVRPSFGTGKHGGRQSFSFGPANMKKHVEETFIRNLFAKPRQTEKNAWHSGAISGIIDKSEQQMIYSLEGK
ncbi:hypothetical protein CHH92_12595 [Bacillus sonorensis]|uniref:Uncharacterized protein n=1 Tax=Bacillus sonorensis L12 TaxID=1274524 RepID=M5P4B6_9BACI|nr:hypothetical protein BSONL12_07757 [Bacillus sonorensis L12]MBG9916211.1 hypothetical protein [Bacillus sonorensis]PAD60002.1 hypothetical protein CHH92_12595 [Bacillus sonorensis]RHJ10769.1 hypothetical protein DW143_07985 [Bacillus sonorensis]TWK76134.1 hypothetical protein CHCC20335_3899 [Bacillus paralicheniformis]